MRPHVRRYPELLLEDVGHPLDIHGTPSTFMEQFINPVGFLQRPELLPFAGEKAEHWPSSA